MDGWATLHVFGNAATLVITLKRYSERYSNILPLSLASHCSAEFYNRVGDGFGDALTVGGIVNALSFRGVGNETAFEKNRRFVDTPKNIETGTLDTAVDGFQFVNRMGMNGSREGDVLSIPGIPVEG